MSSLSQHPEAIAAVTVYCTISISSYREFTYRLVRRRGQSKTLHSEKPRWVLGPTEQIPSLHCGQAGTVAQPGQQEAGPVPGHSPGYHTYHLPLLCSWPDTCQRHSHDNEGKKAEESRAREREHHLLQEARMAKGTET